MSGSVAGAKGPTQEHNAWIKTNLDLDPDDAEADPALPDGMDAVSMQDEDVAAEIANRQMAILDGWTGALANFGTVMTSASDEEAKPKFQKAMLEVVGDLLIDRVIDKIREAPGIGELQKFAKGFAAEAKRAKTAIASATLRDFLVGHTSAITALKQKVGAGRQGFISAVKARREAMEGVASRSMHGKSGLAKPSKESDDDGMMRMALMDVLDRMNATLQASGPQSLFKKLSEEWVAGAEVNAGMGVKLPAFVIVQLEADYSVKQAHFQGTGGQKIAEQLLRDSPEGIDILSLATNKQLFYPGDGNPGTGAIASLDANNRDISNANMGQGATETVIKTILAKGKLIARKVKGDS